MKKHLHILFIISSFLAKSQGFWQRNGNPTIGPNAVTAPVNNFLGTDNTNTNWIKIGVNASQDIFIDNDPNKLYAANPSAPGLLQGGHWVGLGRIFQPSFGN